VVPGPLLEQEMGVDVVVEGGCQHPLDPEPPRDIRHIEKMIAHGLGIAALPLELVEQPAVGEDIDIERPLGQELDVLEIALEFVELSQDIRGEGHRAEPRHLCQPADLDEPLPEIGLPETAVGLHADPEHVRGLDVDPVEQGRAHDRQGIDAGYRNLLLYARPDPWLHQLGVGDGTQQHLVVAPALGLAPLRQDMSVGGAAEEPRELALEHRAPISGP
jgi:hypothetical protein